MRFLPLSSSLPTACCRRSTASRYSKHLLTAQVDTTAEKKGVFCCGENTNTHDSWRCAAAETSCSERAPNKKSFGMSSDLLVRRGILLGQRFLPCSSALVVLLLTLLKPSCMVLLSGGRSSGGGGGEDRGRGTGQRERRSRTQHREHGICRKQGKKQYHITIILRSSTCFGRAEAFQNLPFTG